MKKLINKLNGLELRNSTEAKPRMKVGGLDLGFENQQFSQEYLDIFLGYIDENKILNRFKDIYLGRKGSSTENKAVDHFEYRKPLEQRKNWIIEQQDKAGEAAKKIKDKDKEALIFFGIGGSKLGPQLIQEALCQESNENIIFITGSDPIEASQKTKGLNLDACIFIIASKSFTTLETLTSFEQVAGKNRTKQAFAITADMNEAITFGIPEENVLMISEATGGRFSIWSAINLLFLIQAGRKVTEEFYHGGFEADQNILEAVSLEEVASIFLSAQDIMHNNVLNNETTAILSYDWPMRNFYKFAQQLEMESNGKQVTQEGEKVGYQTNPIIWGGYGPESQHSFYQQIFQGTKDMNLYFLASVNNERQLNTAQYFGQTQSLVEGTTENEILYKQVNKRRFTTIELSEINARTLGNLIATWENKTILNGLIWNINAFDQWGVELGKTNTKKYLKR